MGSTETGQTWAALSGSPRIVGQQAEATVGYYTLAMVDSGTASGSVAVYVPVITPEFWLIVRGSDALNYWRFGRWSSGPYELQQIANNFVASTTLGTATPTPGDRLSCQLGTAISCQVNGSPVVSTNGGFNATGRFAGFAAYDSPARFDDFAVTISCPAAVSHGSAYGLGASTLGATIIDKFGNVATVAPGSPSTADSGTLSLKMLPLVSAGTVSTHSTSGLAPSASTASAVVGELSLLGGAVKATSVTAVSASTASTGAASFGSSGSGVQGLVVNGATLDLPPDSKVPVKVLGVTVAELNVYKATGSTTTTTGTRSASHSVTMLSLMILKPVLGIPAGTQVIVAQAATDAQSPVVAACVPSAGG